MISALACSWNSQSIPFPHKPWVLLYLNKFFATYTPQLDFNTSFKTFLSNICKKLHKVQYAEEKQERLIQSEKQTKSQIHHILHGGSAKCLFQHKISFLPLAITPDPNSEPDRIVTGADAVKSTTVSYFQHLYHDIIIPSDHRKRSPG